MKMSKFQLILLLVFGVFILVAVAVFSLVRSSGSEEVTVSLWGPFPSQEFNGFLAATGLSSGGSIRINYTGRPVAQMESDFTEALATGRGPDIVILPMDMFWKNRSKLAPIPYGTVSERTFKETFAEAGELFLAEEGIYALPFAIDPMVLYYNRDHLTKAGIAQPISYWDEMYSASASLTEKDPAGNIRKSAIALGESINIPHSKDILSMLMLQAGTSITQIQNSKLRSVMSASFDLSVSPGLSALDFYTQFSNPARPFHTWNRSLLPAETHFTAGDSTYYLGFASELAWLKAKNPTLNVALSPVPQSRVSERKTTFGRVYGVAVVRTSRDPASALSAALLLVSRENASKVQGNLFIPPARRDLIAVRPADASESVFYESALQAKGWRDPDSVLTTELFRELIDSVTSGRARSAEALSRTSRELDAMIK